MSEAGWDAREVDRQRAVAVTYLDRELGARGPDHLRFEAAFDEAPLEGEGATWLFSFELEVGGGVAEVACVGGVARHYVAVGQTEPNYFPSYDLSADEAYSFHIGTRFMLGMQVRKVDATMEPPGARDSMRAFVTNYARDVHVESEELAGLFQCDEAVFAVYRLRIDNRPMYCLGADCPPGFYERTEHPAQMVLRLHLGNMIRSEAREARGRRAGE